MFENIGTMLSSTLVDISKRATTAATTLVARLTPDSITSAEDDKRVDNAATVSTVDPYLLRVYAARPRSFRPSSRLLKERLPVEGNALLVPGSQAFTRPWRGVDEAFLTGEVKPTTRRRKPRSIDVPTRRPLPNVTREAQQQTNLHGEGKVSPRGGEPRIRRGSTSPDGHTLGAEIEDQYYCQPSVDSQQKFTPRQSLTKVLASTGDDNSRTTGTRKSVPSGTQRRRESAEAAFRSAALPRLPSNEGVIAAPAVVGGGRSEPDSLPADRPASDQSERGRRSAKMPQQTAPTLTSERLLLCPPNDIRPWKVRRSDVTVSNQSVNRRPSTAWYLTKQQSAGGGQEPSALGTNNNDNSISDKDNGGGKGSTYLSAASARLYRPSSDPTTPERERCPSIEIDAALSRSSQLPPASAPCSLLDPNSIYDHFPSGGLARNSDNAPDSTSSGARLPPNDEADRSSGDRHTRTNDKRLSCRGSDATSSEAPGSGMGRSGLCESWENVGDLLGDGDSGGGDALFREASGKAGIRGKGREGVVPSMKRPRRRSSQEQQQQPPLAIADPVVTGSITTLDTSSLVSASVPATSWTEWWRPGDLGELEASAGPLIGRGRRKAAQSTRGAVSGAEWGGANQIDRIARVLTLRGDNVHKENAVGAGFSPRAIRPDTREAFYAASVEELRSYRPCFRCFDALMRHLEDGTDGRTLGRETYRVSRGMTADPHVSFFVRWESLDKDLGRYLPRGFIGSFTPKPFRSALTEYAVKAASEDPKFWGLGWAQVPDTRCRVIAITSLEVAQDENDWLSDRHGLLLSFRDRTGRHSESVIFPETMCKARWTKKQTIDALYRKAGWLDPPRYSSRIPTSSTDRARSFAGRVSRTATDATADVSRPAVIVRFETVSFRMDFRKYQRAKMRASPPPTA